MAKERKAEVRTVVVRQSPVGVIIACACCLGAGLAIGYFYGKESGNAAIAGNPVQVQTPTTGDPSLLQHEMTLKSILASNPKDLNTLIQLGNVYYDGGRFGEAVDAYGRALELDPKNADVRTDRGTCYWSMGQPDAALAEFAKALETAPTKAQTLYNMGVVYLNGKKDSAKAKAVWEQLLATNPDYPDRAKVQEQIASLAASTSAPATSPAPAAKTQSPGVEDLVNRLKKK
jgi:cytochrome c-type biogenesis protein CcmH/NrfG